MSWLRVALVVVCISAVVTGLQLRRPYHVQRSRAGISSLSNQRRCSKLYASSESDVSAPSVWKSVKTAAAKAGSSLLLAGALLGASSLPVSAKPSKPSSSKTTTSNGNSNKGGNSNSKVPSNVASTKNKRAKVDVVVDKRTRSEVKTTDKSEEDEALQRKRLNMIGFALVAGSALVFFGLSPADNNKKTTKKPKKKVVVDDEDEDDVESYVFEDREEDFFASPSPSKVNKRINSPSSYFDDVMDEGRGPKSSSVSQLNDKRKAWAANNEVSALSTRADALFEEDEEIEEVLKASPKSLKIQSRHPSKVASVTELDNDFDMEESIPAELPSVAKIMAAPEDSKLPVERINEAPKAVESKPPPAKKQGLLSRIFQRSGSGRPTSLKQALEVEDDSREFRLTVASVLSRFVPDEVLEDLKELRRTMDVDVTSMEGDAIVDYAKSAMIDADLEPQQAANAFADVTNVFITHLIDKAGQHADDKDDKLAIKALDKLAEFVENVGSIFVQLTPGVQIEPIQYNGKTKKGKLETLFLKYVKSTMDVKSMLGMAMGQSEGDQGETVDRVDRLGKLQYLFDIKEAKRSSIEQKVTRDMMLGMTKELASGGGDLSSMFGGMGNGDGMDQEEAAKAFSELLGGSGGGNFSDLAGELPDFSKMNPDEAADVMKESLAGLREAVDRGELKKEDIGAIEEMLGMDVRQFAKIDRNQLRNLGPGMADFVDLFKKLADMKDSM